MHTALGIAPGSTWCDNRSAKGALLLETEKTVEVARVLRGQRLAELTATRERSRLKNGAFNLIFGRIKLAFAWDFSVYWPKISTYF